MIIVYIREVAELNSHRLGQFMPEAIPALVQLFKDFGTAGQEDGIAVFHDAQFYAAEGHAYFEILIEVEQ